MSLATTLLAAAEEAHHGNVALETVIFGIIAVAVFAVLGLITFSYRDVANRHAGKADAFSQRHGSDLEHRAGHGH
ncbi:hypothetical protein M4I32_01585 [Microbacterium sp. LRZ72]|uniref:hypothetical protein n=1 Tax=Microbacterium sp. LRZ72 TaxID=2942481 RepID=UPI0029A376E1|nr:hypothetical protein [Microbacterium sp. LRZ72]MDX2375490.1 hypothetical protein [Microbacterium sp. LRZ72]